MRLCYESWQRFVQMKADSLGVSYQTMLVLLQNHSTLRDPMTWPNAAEFLDRAVKETK